MDDIAKLSRAMGRVESGVQTLFHKYDELHSTIKQMDARLSKRQWWDSARILIGAYCGGMTVVMAKQIIFGG